MARPVATVILPGGSPRPAPARWARSAARPKAPVARIGADSTVRPARSASRSAVARNAPRRPVERVEGEEEVRQAVVEDRVLGVEPFAVEDIAVPEPPPQPVLQARRPGLEQIEVPFPRTAREGVAADAGVGAVELLGDDEVPVAQVGQGHRLQVLIPSLQARALEVRGAGKLDQVVHGHQALAIATI